MKTESAPRQFIAFDTPSADMLRSAATQQGLQGEFTFCPRLRQWEISLPQSFDVSGITACFVESF